MFYDNHSLIHPIKSEYNCTSCDYNPVYSYWAVMTVIIMLMSSKPCCGDDNIDNNE